MNKLRYSYIKATAYLTSYRLLRFIYLLPKKTKTICVVLCSVIVFVSPLATITAASNAPGQYTLISLSETASFYLGSVNKLRLQKGLKPLDYDYRLEASALNKANDMITNNYWGHVSPKNVQFYDFIWHDKPSVKYVGENLARCYDSVQETFDGLINSYTHYNVMTNKKFKYFGVSEVINQKEYCVYTVMHFSN